MLDNRLIILPYFLITGVLDWSNEILASGSRDRAVSLQDYRCPSSVLTRLTGHYQEVTKLVDLLVFGFAVSADFCLYRVVLEKLPSSNFC